MLKVTGAKIDLILDHDIYLFFEEGVRGGISVISKRFSEANNKYMAERHDLNRHSVYIQHVDMNALYSSAMQEKLPHKNFEWIDNVTLCKMEKDHSLIKSCTLEVDLDVPQTKEFHGFTNCYPLAPEI